MRFTLYLLLLLLPSFVQAQDPGKNPGLLTIDRLFGGGEFRAVALGEFQWDKSGDGLYTIEDDKSVEGGQAIVRTKAATGEKEIVIPAKLLIPAGEQKPLPIDDFTFSKDESKVLIYTNSQRVWRQNTRGDYWALDLKSKKLQKLGGDAVPSTLQFAKFTPDNQNVTYVRANNLYVESLADGKITPLTTDGNEKIINGTADWVNEEEQDIRDAYRISPDGKQIAFWQFDTNGVKEYHLVNTTDSNYSKITAIPYPKCGEQNSATRIGVVNITGGPVTWMKIEGDPRENYIPHIAWTSDSKNVLIQQLNRNQTELKVLGASASTGATEQKFLEQDPAWVNNDNPFRFMEGGKSLLWLSELDGWRRLYAKSLSANETKNLHVPDYDIIDLEFLDEKNHLLYFAASPQKAVERHIFVLNLKTNKVGQLTSEEAGGWNTFNFSPNGNWAIHTHSSFTNPPVVRMISLNTWAKSRSLVDNAALKEKLKTLTPTRSEFLQIDIGEIKLDAWRILPPNFDETKKYPLIVHVYGEPFGQNVRDIWGGPRQLWHTMLAQKGAVVVCIDNRGTPSPRGREFRKIVNKQIGILAPADQAKAVEKLVKDSPYLDKDRIGVWGWSGGGSMTLHAMLQYPDLYKTGIAVAPVPDMSLYDTIYEERYMKLPKDNAENYKKGSPITYAKNLKGNLLVIHGSGDDNCHIQGVEKLVNEFVKHDKQFSLMIYPNRSHSISEGEGTTKHLYNLMTRYFEEHVLKN
jgi:dipeptidyl-peptidase 4